MEVAEERISEPEDIPGEITHLNNRQKIDGWTGRR